MSTELIINASLPETRIALMENGEIQDLLIERASGKGIVGNIYKGRVTRVLPGMQAAFVDIGLEKAAFLYVDDVFVHSEIWEAEEGAPDVDVPAQNRGEKGVIVQPAPASEGAVEGQLASGALEGAAQAPAVVDDDEAAKWEKDARPLGEVGEDDEEDEDEIGEGEFVEGENDDEEDDDDEGHGPVGMCPPPGEGDEGGSGGGDPQGTVRPEAAAASPSGSGSEESDSGSAEAAGDGGEGGEAGRKRRHRRGRRGGRFRKRNRGEGDEVIEGGVPGVAAVGAAGGPIIRPQAEGGTAGAGSEDLPDTYRDQVSDEGGSEDSDRSTMSDRSNQAAAGDAGPQAGRPQAQIQVGSSTERPQGPGKRPEFKETRSRDRRVKPKQAARSVRQQANIQDLLKEGQEVIVQVAKDPIATKGARLTCHISLPGRHLVCMPTIDHVGVSRRIERDDERRKLREYVERYRPKNLGFIVRTASGRQQSEKRIKQDIEYLTRLWSEIREKAAEVTAPALVYEDLNSVLRAIRDWVTEDIDKIIVDSRYHYNDILRFVSHFMPSLKQKVELYHGDVPIFDAYMISTELARGLERKVWLKSGGYLVVDQAEALVAIDVNTGRFVGKKNLEDTILKTNLEAVVEIAYQLRLRNCGGIIILDLIDMEREENKQRVYRALEEALKKDRARPSILKISELGLVEMTRKRTRDTMVRALCESCSHCEGKGFVKSKQTVAYEVLRELEREGIEKDVGKVLVQAHPDVIDMLAIDERDTLDGLERRYRKQVYLQAVLDYHVERFEITGDKMDKAEREALGITSDDRGPRPERGRNGRERDNTNDRGGGGSGGDRNGGRGKRGGKDRGRERTDRDRPAGGAVTVRPNDGTALSPIQASVDGKDYRQLPVPVATGQIIVNPPVVNIAPVAGHQGYDTPGNSMPQPIGEGGVQAPRTPGVDDFYDEEDRLAFLRAQAAQDAALARLGGGAGTPGADPSRRAPQGAGLGRAPVQGSAEGRGGGRDAAGPGGRRGRRGRRGGKFRPGEGPEDGAPAPTGGRGPRSAGPRADRPPGSAPVVRPVSIIPVNISVGAPPSAPSGGSEGGGSDSSGGGDGGGNGGGSDRSNPPTT